MFKRAQRKNTPMKLAIYGVSGSGKTMGALKIASGMGKKIALIDTENGSAALYSEQFNFDCVEISPPFTTEKYIEAINEAIKQKYEVLIIDSMTHAWAAEGGLLEQKENIDIQNPRSNTYTSWRPVTKKQNSFMSAILHADIHIIGTMRSKQDYAMVQNEQGKIAPKKVGLAPIQRDGIEYEFTTVLEVDAENNTKAVKDRTELFKDKVFKITPEVGKAIINWFNGPQEKPAVKPETSMKQPESEPKKIINYAPGAAQR
jgi:hypothetical protein